MSDKERQKEQKTQEEHSIYGVSQETISALENALEANEFDRVKDLLKPFHSADVASIIEYLTPHQRHDLIEVIRPEFDPEILMHLNETVREEIIDQLGMSDFVLALKGLESDDALALIEDLEENQQKEILKFIPLGERVILEEVLAYPEQSAARLMQREIVCVPSFWTLDETKRYIAEEKNLPETFYDIFVVDPKHYPVGGVPLNSLLKYPSSTKIKDIMTKDIRRIPANMDQEEVALLFQKYGLVSAPVVDDGGRIIGMITVDDVVNVIEEEAEEDIMRLARVTESDFYEPLLSTSYSRLRWLFISLINTLLAATVISQFQPTIEKMVALAVLMPISAAMSGNAGMQVVTVTVRALATRELGGINMRRAIAKEVLVGLINGIVFGGIGGTIAAFWFSDPALGIVLGSALIFNMMWAACCGVVLPIIINRLKMDPAISAGPFLTTTTDLLGFATFLGLAAMFLV